MDEMRQLSGFTSDIAKTATLCENSRSYTMTIGKVAALLLN